MYADSNGCYRLCQAVIRMARQDYITGTDRDCEALEKWVRSKAFGVFSLGAHADPEDVIYAWREQRRRHRDAQLVRVRNRME